jgi:hypothetical protein
VDPFSYIVVLTSIVLGLGVTRLVGGLGHLLQTRKRRRNYWVHVVWMLNLLLLTALVWFIAYRWRTNERWTFFLFVWLLLTPTILYLISSLFFPDQDTVEPIEDWRVYFYDEIFLLLAALFPIDLIDTALKGLAHFQAQGPLYAGTMTMWCVLSLVAAFTRSRRYHGWFAIFFLLYNLAFAGMTLITAQDRWAPGCFGRDKPTTSPLTCDDGPSSPLPPFGGRPGTTA